MQSSEGGVKEATLVALKGVMAHAGKSVSSPIIARVLVTLQVLLPSEEDEVRTSAATTLGIVAEVCSINCHFKCTAFHALHIDSDADTSRYFAPCWSNFFHSSKVMREQVPNKYHSLLVVFYGEGRLTSSSVYIELNIIIWA